MSLFAGGEDIVLRPYQERSVEALRQGIRMGHRAQVLCSPTGSGKTVIAGHMLLQVQQLGTKAAFVVDRVSLCDQTSREFWKFGIDHGLLQSQNTFGRDKNIQVCSAQTVEKRGFWPDLDLLLIDEAHAQRKFITEFIQHSRIPVIGLTATPFSKGMGHTYSNVVNVTTTDQLISEGFLAPLKVYAAKEIDMTGAKTNSFGEWSDKEVEQRGSQIVGDIVSEWVDKTWQHFGGPVKTIAFSATVDHGAELCQEFQAAGYDFQQISYKDKNDDRRRELIQAFREGDITGLVSCEALAKGFDVPDVLCGISARPYRKSFSGHIQQIGRGMRSSPGKEFCLWLDHCIASGSRVLSDKGLVPIEKVTTDHLLWDGHEFVRHNGVVSKGIQECITYAGLTATPDHRVKTRRGWMAFGEVAEKQIPIIATGFGRSEIWERDNCIAGGRMAWAEKFKAAACAMRMRYLWLPINHCVLEFKRWENEGLPSMQSAKVLPRLAISAVSSNAISVQQQRGLQLRALWRSRRRVSFQESEIRCNLDHQEPGVTGAGPRLATRSHRQRWALRARKPSMVAAKTEYGQHSKYSLDSTYACVSTPKSWGEVCRRYVASLDVGGFFRRRNSRAISPSIVKTKRQVWDVLNAGPRNCFTCEGLLVHNCGNYMGFYDRMMEFFANGVDALDEGGRDNQIRDEKVKEKTDFVCQCGYVLLPEMESCPACGKERHRKSKVETVAGQMIEIEGKHLKKKKPEKEYLQDKELAWRGILCDARSRKPGDLEAAKKFALAQYRNFYDEWPPNAWGDAPGAWCDPRLSSHIRANMIRHAKRMKRRAA